MRAVFVSAFLFFIALPVFAQEQIFGLGQVEPVEVGVRDELSLYRCVFVNCEEERVLFFGDAFVTSPLSVFSDYQEVQRDKRSQISTKNQDLIAYREYKKTQEELASKVGAPEAPCDAGKCILVALSRQMVFAYEDGVLKNSSVVSSGLSATPTPVGQFAVYGKSRSQKMSGPGYYLPNVPHILWFHGDYALHGAYWHTNFGHPASHGCVNLPLGNAEWFFNWANVGTPVIVSSS